jgi:alkanesulfonate monooxygenase SsuD/methylene tetrahydromethanopterin reductase-like flavin-dependent oxidoreductase (luciferase family)
LINVIARAAGRVGRVFLLARIETQPEAISHYARDCYVAPLLAMTGDDDMKLDAALPTVQLKDVPAIAKAAQEIGFDALWTQETQHDPFLPCALIAEHSETLRFGTAIAVSFARSPANLAYTAWDLSAQSGGRFILGLGTQVKAHIERRFGMTWPESVTGKLREQIQVIRAFWDCWQNSTKLNFRGEYYKATLNSLIQARLNIPIFQSTSQASIRDLPNWRANCARGSMHTRSIVRDI